MITDLSEENTEFFLSLLSLEKNDKISVNLKDGRGVIKKIILQRLA